MLQVGASSSAAAGLVLLLPPPLPAAVLPLLLPPPPPPLDAPYRSCSAWWYELAPSPAAACCAMQWQRSVRFSQGLGSAWMLIAF